MDPRRGLAGPREFVDALTMHLGLDFKPRQVTARRTMREEPRTVTVWVRSLSACARWHFRHTLAELSVPFAAHNAAGERTYADPMSCEWAHNEYRSVRSIHPHGACLLPFAIACDKTDLSKEQSAEPVYMVNNALPLHLRRMRKFWMPVAYLTNLDESAEWRRVVLLATLEILFEEYSSTGLDNPAAFGELMLDADGIERTVFVRFQNLILDYPVVAAWTFTLMNRACFVCDALTGSYHHTDSGVQRIRSVASESARVETAFADHPHSNAKRKAALRPFGLHAQRNPLWKLRVVGFDIYQSITFSKLHMIYEGIWKVLVECWFDRARANCASAAAFNALGARIDAWVKSRIGSLPYTKTTFSGGISRYFHKPTEGGSHWAHKVRFGKITSATTWRDIMRFWRLLLFELFPDDTVHMTIATEYLLWVRTAEQTAPTDSDLLAGERHHAAWLAPACHTFGEHHFDKRIKSHAPLHNRQQVKLHGSNAFQDDAQAEAAHLEGAKQPWMLTNWRNVTPQLGKIVARRDSLRLLTMRSSELQSAMRTAAQPPGTDVGVNADADAESRRARAGLLKCRPNGGFGAAGVTLDVLAAKHPSLSQLPYAIRRFLEASQGGNIDSAVRLMPQLDVPTLWPKPGVRVELRNDPQVAARIAAGRRILQANVLESGQKPSMGAIAVGGAVWYAQLLLCFDAQYMGRRVSLVYVRWLDEAAEVVRGIARIEGRAMRSAEDTYLRSMRRAPFQAFRWERFAGNRTAGHPPAGAPAFGVVRIEEVLYRAPLVCLLSDAVRNDDPTFLLNTDMWDL